jgi:hypothetical protein
MLSGNLRNLDDSEYDQFNRLHLHISNDHSGTSQYEIKDSGEGHKITVGGITTKGRSAIQSPVDFLAGLDSKTYTSDEVVILH